MRTFAEALGSGDLKAIRAFPKTDLHNHSVSGGHRAAIAQRLGARLMTPPGRMQTFPGFLQVAYGLAGAVFDAAGGMRQGLELLNEAAFEAARDDGVSVLEMSIHAGFVTAYGDGAKGLVQALRAAHERLAPDMVFLPEVGIAREADPDESRRWAEALIDTGFFGSIDLYGDEMSRPVSVFRHLYRSAKASGLRLKAHVGEYGDAASVRDAVEVLDLDEVQHGIAAAESRSIMTWLREQETQLNVCPTSNVRLCRTGSIETHPIRKLLDNGVRVTINTDDVMIFDQTVSREYLSLYQAGVCTRDELEAIRCAGLASRGDQSSPASP